MFPNPAGRQSRRRAQVFFANGPNPVTVSVGNSTSNTTINSTVMMISSGPITVTTTSIMVGNSTQNTTIGDGTVGIDIGNSTINSSINSTSVFIGAINSTAVGVSLANNLITIGNSTVNATINSTVFSQTSNNATNLGGVAAASYINTSGSYVISGFHTYGNLTMNVVITNTSVAVGTINSTAVGILVANNLLTIGNSTVNTTANSTTFSGIALTANNATNLGGVASGSYVNTIGNYTLSGNITHTPAAVGGIPVNIRGVASGTANLFQVGNSVTAAQFAVNSTGFCIGNGAGLTSIISASNLVATGTATGAVPLAAVGAASATANLFQVSNSGSVIFAINSIGVLVGNGFGLTSVTAVAGPAGANQQIQFNDSTAMAGDLNLTWDKTADQLTVGNSTINVNINSTSMEVGVVNSTSVGLVTANNLLKIGNSSVNSTVNSTIFTGTSLLVPANAGVVSNSTGVWAQGAGSKSFSVITPTAADQYILFYTNTAITLANVITLITNTGASAWCNTSFYFGANLAAAGTGILLANTANSTLGLFSAPGNTAVAAGNWIWCNVNAVGATTAAPATFSAVILFK